MSGREVEVVGWAEMKELMTEWIWVASSRVGEMMTAPISFFPSPFSRRSSFSRIGMTKASVFPEPVTACSFPKQGQHRSTSSLRHPRRSKE